MKTTTQRLRGDNRRARSSRHLERWFVFAMGLLAVSVGHIESSWAGAVVDCGPGVLPKLEFNDDDRAGPIDIGFNVKFGNAPVTDKVYLDNNGFILFRNDSSLWWQLQNWERYTVPLIAPFQTDVDTRGHGTVTHGPYSFEGLPAYCFTWNDVGYFDSHSTPTNRFQLILVKQSGDDFDIVMNYDHIGWEAGDGAGAVNGIGGTFSPRVGFYDGANATELPGSRAISALLDGGQFELRGGRHNTGIDGRYRFPIRQVPPWIVSGGVHDRLGNPIARAPVQLCLNGASPPVCYGSISDATGRYSVTIPSQAAADWILRGFPPANTQFNPSALTTLNLTGSYTADLELIENTPIPLGTSFDPQRVNDFGYVSLFWRDSLQLSTQGFSGAIAEYRVQQTVNGVVQNIATGVLDIEEPLVPGCILDCDSLYKNDKLANPIGPFAPSHGFVKVTVTLTCPWGSSVCTPGTTAVVSFDAYIDPSGFVRSTRGTPVVGATVTLYRAESPYGPFTVVPDGSALMSPTNRTNPDRTDAYGHFGWDVVAGYYVVRAEKAGCNDPRDPSRSYVETPILPVPPPWFDLDLVLDCEASIPPEITVPGSVTADATSARGAVVRYQASAFDVGDGVVPVSCTPASGSRFPLGETQVKCSASDRHSNQAVASFEVLVSYDWTGLLTPRERRGTRRVRGNSTVPVRFALDGVSAWITDALARLWVAPLDSNVPGVEMPATPSGSANRNGYFRYERREGYVFNWSTRGLAPGRYRLRVDLGDGVLRVATVDVVRSCGRDGNDRDRDRDERDRDRDERDCDCNWDDRD